MANVNRCPKCGRKPELVRSDELYYAKNKLAYRYHCPQCHISGDNKHTRDGAAASWHLKILQWKGRFGANEEI